MTQFNFEAWLAALAHDCDDDLPSMPVDTAVREGRALHDVAEARREKFANLATFDLACIDALPVLAAKLSDAESEWQRLKLSTTVSALQPARAQAEGLRSDFLASARFYMRKSPEALTRLDHIADGSGLDDLTADLGEIARIAEENPELFAQDANLPKDLPAFTRSLEGKLSASKESAATRAALVQRNRVFRLLDDAVSEVRDAGRYLYRKDPRTQALFGSPYAARKARRHRARIAEPSATPAAPSTNDTNG